MSVSFRQIERDEEVEALAHMAHHIWNEYWPALIGQEQTDYMVEKFQSLNAFRADIADNGYEYFFIMDRENATPRELDQAVHGADIHDEGRPAPAGADDAAPGPVTFTDDLGNEVTVDNPQRVVACMGSFANAWELAGGTLVGVSDDALQAAGWTIASPDVATVGDFASVNLEAIIALDPDFVIMTSGTGGRAARAASCSWSWAAWDFFSASRS